MRSTRRGPGEPLASDGVALSKANPLNAVLAVVIVGAVWWSAAGTGFSLTEPFAPENVRSVARFISGAFPPDVSPAFLGSVARLLVETIQISIMGTAAAIILAAPLAAIAMRRSGEEFSRAAQGPLAWSLRWASYSAARTVLNVLRAVPELAWALLFVVAVGLGPFPGALALAAHSTGVLGKLYAELFESVDPRLVEAGRATGARELAVLLFVRVPAVLPVMLSYTLFRWECNLRAATVLGFVGAGGLGTQLSISMKLFQYNQVLTLTLVLLGLVVLVDLLGQVARSRILDGASVERRASEPVEAGGSARARPRAPEAGGSSVGASRI